MVQVNGSFYRKKIFFFNCLSTLCLSSAHLASARIATQLPVPTTHNLPGYIPPELRDEYRNGNGKNTLHRYEPGLVMVFRYQLTSLEINSIALMISSTALAKEHPSLRLPAMPLYSMRPGLQVKPTLRTVSTAGRH